MGSHQRNQKGRHGRDDRPSDQGKPISPVRRMNWIYRRVHVCANSEHKAANSYAKGDMDSAWQWT